MVCKRCKIDKEPCLFTPSQLASRYPQCRKCCAERNRERYGHNIPKLKKQAYALTPKEYAMKKNAANKNFEAAEVARLLEQRRQRLAKTPAATKGVLHGL